MGLPMVVAIILFLTYHFIGIFAKNSAEDGTMHPFIASWLSTVIMLPLGVWLTYRATTDQGIFDIDSFMQRIGRLFGRSKPELEVAGDQPQILLTQQEKALLLSRDETQLKDILKNYRQYGYSEEIRLGALERLKEKGYSETELKVTGDFENAAYTNASQAMKRFTKNSKRAVALYVLTLVSFVFLSITYMTQSAVVDYIATGFLYLRPLFILLFYFFGIRAMLNHTKFVETIGKKKDTGIWLIFLLFGLLIYIFMHWHFKKKMKEELQMIR